MGDQLRQSVGRSAKEGRIDHDDLQTVSLSRDWLRRLRLWLSGTSSGRGRGPTSARH
jgi:hypothetical protein